MPHLKGSKTHDNLKAAFAGESQANRRYLYFAKEADVEGRPESRASSATPPRARRATPTATSTSSRRSETRPPASRSATPRRTSPLPSRARPTSTRRCIRASPRRRETRGSRDRRVVRDARQGGEGARRPLREGPGAGQGRRLTPRRERPPDRVSASCSLLGSPRGGALHGSARMGARLPGDLSCPLRAGPRRCAGPHETVGGAFAARRFQRGKQ